MALILDTGIVYAYYDRADAWHARAKDVMIGAAAAGLLLPSPILPEVDHLVRHRLGVEACRMFYAGLLDGSYVVADVPREQYARIVELNRQYPDLGFVDASVVAIAEARRLRRIATTDRRHFGPMAAALSIELVP